MKGLMEEQEAAYYTKSCAETEYRAVAKWGELVWLKQFPWELGFDVSSPIRLFVTISLPCILPQLVDFFTKSLGGSRVDIFVASWAHLIYKINI